MMANKAKKGAIKAAVTGGLLAASTRILYGGGNLNLLGASVPQEIVMFAAGAAGSAVSDMTKDWVLANIPGNMNYVGLESGLVNAGLVAGGAVAVLAIGSDVRSDMYMKVGALGAASGVAADYVTNNLLSGAGGQLIF